MREQQAKITGALVGPTELFIGLGRDPQHNEHTKGWRWHLYLQDAKLRAAAVREEGLRIIARINARNEAAYQEAAE